MHQLPFTALLNKLLGGAVTALLTALGIHPAHPATPITNAFAMEIFVALLLVGFFLAARASLSVEKRGALQQTIETVYGLMDAQSEEIIGHDHRRYLSYLITLGMFILLCNMLGLVPFFESPTGSPVVPLGCAIVTWFFYQMHGFRANGIGYLKHFAGPVWWLAPLMFVIEVCSHLARMLSLTVRLFANMFAGDMVTLVFFSLLPMVYIGEAVAHESH